MSTHVKTFVKKETSLHVVVATVFWYEIPSLCFLAELQWRDIISVLCLAARLTPGPCATA